MARKESTSECSIPLLDHRHHRRHSMMCREHHGYLSGSKLSTFSDSLDSLAFNYAVWKWMDYQRADSKKFQDLPCLFAKHVIQVGRG